MLSLKTGIEDLKQAKILMSEANGIMSDHISRLKALEEENAALKDELDDWKGNAEGFQPDAYMKLPVDADGEPIRIGDVVYDESGIAWTATCLRMSKFGCKVGMSDMPILREPFELTHEKPELADSWEKLEEDAKKHVCSYFGIDQDTASCKDCPHGSKRTGRTCWQDARLDILARAKKLAGIEEEA